MSDDYTILNPGSGGSVMDETSVVYPSAPTIRKRPRLVITGENIDEIVPVVNSELAGNEYGLVTRSIVPSYPGESITIFDISTLVPTNTETTVASYTVPAGKQFNFIGLIASGNANALFKLYVAGNPILVVRNTVANLTVTLDYSYAPFKVSEGDTIVIKVLHQANVNCDFESTLLGYNL